MQLVPADPRVEVEHEVLAVGRRLARRHKAAHFLRAERRSILPDVPRDPHEAHGIVADQPLPHRCTQDLVEDELHHLGRAPLAFEQNAVQELLAGERRDLAEIQIADLRDDVHLKRPVLNGIRPLFDVDRLHGAEVPLGERPEGLAGDLLLHRSRGNALRLGALRVVYALAPLSELFFDF